MQRSALRACSPLVLGVCLALLPLVADAGPRRALLVGSPRGDAGEPMLRHTDSDVRRMREVLVGWGRFEARDVEVLEDVTAEKVLARLDALAKQGAEAPETFLFFYSGHADSSALHLAGSRLPLDTLRTRLKAVRAGLRLAILDACQSGGALRRKGVSRTQAFDISLKPAEAEGMVILSSSSADEESFESDDGQGAIFTLHLTSGLRGAADGNGDAQVSLSEAARYAYAQTVRSTLHVSSGAQHPMYQWEVVGRRDPVLSWIDSTATLTFAGESEREYVVFDEDERNVLAEINATGKTQPRVALAPATYVIRQRSGKGSRVARVQLRRGDHRVLHDHQMREMPVVALAQKGALGQRWVLASAGLWAFQGFGKGMANGEFASRLEAGLEWERPRWTFGLSAGMAQTTRTDNDLETHHLLLGPSASVLWTARGEWVSFRAGPLLGLAYARQSSLGDEPRHALVPSLGLRLRSDVAVHPRLGFFTTLTPQWVAGRYTTPHERDSGVSLGSGWRLLGGLELALGVRVSW